MRRTLKTNLTLALVILGLTAACSEANRSSAGVELIGTTSQDVLVVDLLNPADGPLGTILLQAIQTGTTTDSRFLDVNLINYRVSYERTDGGTQVPETFVRTTSGVIAVGGGATALNSFQIFTNEMLQQAPFVALLPQNGGRDPQTGQPIVKMNAVVDIFGETLSGKNVSTRVRIPLWFCAGCTT